MNPILKLDKKQILDRYIPINSYTHKGIQGHALIIAGSYGKIGAAVLASKACLKSGCGLVTAFVPKCGYEILQISNPEVMALTNLDVNYITSILFDIHPQAIAIGPGLSLERPTQIAVYDFLKSNKTPLVIDADALNILALNKEWLNLLEPKTILTPHPKELERLIGNWDSEDEKMSKTISFSKQFDVIIVMKGAPTHIIDGETVYQNTTGNAALATAGSGDALTGIITGLLAQSYSAIDATLLAVYLHGLAADIALPETGMQSFIASDIINYLGKAFLSIDH